MALSQEVDFPWEAGLRAAVADARRREESIAVEFLKIGSLDQMLWLRDADRSYPVHCDIYKNAKPPFPVPRWHTAYRRKPAPLTAYRRKPDE